MKKFKDYIKENSEYISFNDIKTYDINETSMHIGNKNLKDLNGIENYTKLKIFWCNNNNIVSLEPLKTLINIYALDCYNNQITSLEPIKNLINLKTLYCQYNQLKSFKGLPENVTILSCSDNPLNNWGEDVDAFIKAYKLSIVSNKEWFNKQDRFNEIIDLIKINMI